MKQPGYLVVSLDFELMWGMFDKVTTESYGDNITGVRVAIPELLKLFEAYGIHATWATIGMLMFEDAEELTAALPPSEQQPNYHNPALSSYEHFCDVVRNTPELRDYYFAPELVRKIIETPGQEIASHTFSHYYCLDGGGNSEAIFSADVRAMQKAADRFDVTLKSIVFPRNQTNEESLQVCAEEGLTVYRGTENHFLYTGKTEDKQTKLTIRALRLLDHYFNFSGYHTYQTSAINRTKEGLANIPSSRFFRPYSRMLRHLESLRLRRIKRAMTHAAEQGEVFHLWWHPHNFGINRKENFANLVELLEHFKQLQSKYGMESRNMAELATLVPAAPASETEVD